MCPSLSKERESQVVEMLSQVPLFSALDKRQLRAIAESSHERKFEPGETIEKEGDMGITFYLISSGAVEIKKGKRKLSDLGRGQFFGEMALLDRQPRSATVVATEPTEVLMMTAWSFRGFLETQPKLAVSLLQELARRLRETDRSLSE